jgi:hypothetical protein
MSALSPTTHSYCDAPWPLPRNISRRGWPVRLYGAAAPRPCLAQRSPPTTSSSTSQTATSVGLRTFALSRPIGGGLPLCRALPHALFSINCGLLRLRPRHPSSAHHSHPPWRPGDRYVVIRNFLQSSSELEHWRDGVATAVAERGPYRGGGSVLLPTIQGHPTLADHPLAAQDVEQWTTKEDTNTTGVFEQRINLWMTNKIMRDLMLSPELGKMACTLAGVDGAN